MCCAQWPVASMQLALIYQYAYNLIVHLYKLIILEFYKLKRCDVCRFFVKYNIPGVIGCIDCTHVPIIRPSTNEERYFNRKHFHSLNTQVVSIYIKNKKLNQIKKKSNIISLHVNNIVDNSTYGRHYIALVICWYTHIDLYIIFWYILLYLYFVLQICDAECYITNADASYGGATHDCFIWSHHEIKTHLESLDETAYLFR